MSQSVSLYRKNDQVFAHTSGKEDAEVKILMLRPVSGRSGEVSLMGDKEEFAMLKCLDELDGASRAIADDELQKFYFCPKITRINKAEAHFGTRFLHVQTDKGPRSLALKNPYINIRFVGDQVVVRDVIGNMFLIASFSALDVASKEELDKIL